MKRQDVLFHQVVSACDVVVLVASYAAAYEIRDHFLRLSYGPLFSSVEYVWILWVILPTWLLLLQRFGLNKFAGYESLQGIMSSLLRVQVFGGLILASVMYMSHSAQISRLFLQIFLGTSYLGLSIEKAGVKGILVHYRQARHAHLRQVLIVGTEPRAERYFQLLCNQLHWRAEVLGFLSVGCSENKQLCGKPVLGPLADLVRVLQKHVVDEVMVVTCPEDELRKWTVQACMEKGVTVRFAMEVPVAGVGKYCLEDVGMGRYFVSLEAIPQDPIPLLIKRMMDIIGATVGLVLYVIAYLWYGPKIRRESPGPLLFHQTRVGQNGRLFTLYKFRTMYSGAHEQLETLYARNEMLGYIFKMKDDPRVTSIGRGLRRRHLDELPQFWNVLRGEISLVGTRPPTPNEVAQYKHHHYRRLSMRPGLTGLWQVYGNGGVKDFEDIVRLDCEYIDNWSLWLDCKILAKTVVKVMRGEGW
jgi:exopolysaccharide biosynthesis polyprenyl glycosylphosphotransferase